MPDDTKKHWCNEARGILNAQLKRQGITHEELVHRLAEISVLETQASIANKLCRGTFSAAFLLQVLMVTAPKEQKVVSITILDQAICA
ncbi:MULTISPECIES: DUF6471 domain-containing protein [Pseudodesulfovibrio]|uniref:DUF6471 domain-containing protein n=1 Tax=Pseudodesulfovibrio aespoeensis (strain ATCC 700646 / DSM 10631 / Aspo-2) TaxID=643562 RepID=E6VVH6_PSEA9|nr:hypothetical protein Daes_2532 [Pseudodesulfovibrio aespoeensis Aspo-2]